MRKIQFITVLMSVVMSLTVFSSGFATWFSMKWPTASSSGGALEAFPVHDCISLSPGTLRIFKFTSLHFVDEEGKASNTGTISATYIINVVESRALLAESGKTTDQIPVEITLSYDNLRKVEGAPALFAVEGDNTITATINGTEVTLKNNDTTLVASTTLTPGEDATAMQVKVEFIFNIPYDDDALIGNFRQNFGQYLKVFEDDKTTFTTEARIVTD